MQVLCFRLPARTPASSQSFRGRWVDGQQPSSPREGSGKACAAQIVTEVLNDLDSAGHCAVA